MQRFDHGGDIYSRPGIRLDFSANLNPLGMPPGVRQALMDGLDDFQRYPDPQCRALRSALAEKHSVDQEQLLLGNGAADLIMRICACLKPGLALVTAPTFSEYERAVLVHGGQVQHHLLDAGAEFDLDEGILPAIQPGVNLVFLCSPNNPTGRLISTDLLLRVLRRCQEVDALLVLDECFIDFTEGQSLIPRLDEHPQLLILRAFTKMYAMAGLRLGYLLCSDRALLQRIGSFGATWSVSGPAQVAGLAALKTQGWVERTRSLVCEERAFMTDALLQLGLEVLPAAANYLLMHSPHPLYQGLLRQGILVRDCGNYTGLSHRNIRIGLKTRAENQLLLQAIREMLHG